MLIPAQAGFIALSLDVNLDRYRENHKEGKVIKKRSLRSCYDWKELEDRH
jgi:hypothetical protein